MPEMPQRPRAHVLETESRGAFARAIDEHGWVVRAMDNPDYGLDDQVEVFENGSATGLIFYAQVRGTDEPSLDRALKVRVRSQQQAYFAAVGEPVLIVRYHSPSRRCFGQWFHRIDPHPGRSTGTIDVRDPGELTPERVQQLANEVRLVRQLRSAAAEWPLAIVVNSSTNHSPMALAVAMRAVATDDRQRFVRFHQRDAFEGGPSLSIDVDADSMTVHGGLTSITFHGDFPRRSVEEVAGDAVLGLAAALGALDHFEAASKLLEFAATTAPSFREDLLLRMSGVLAKGHRLREALHIGHALVGTGRRPEARLFVSLVAMGIAHALDPRESADVGDFLLEDAAIEEAEGESGKAATLHYSAGNWLFHSVHDYPAALQAYERAAVLDASYEARDYYVHERAAALFECQRFDESAAWYRRAIGAGSANRRTRARLADAVMHAGRYEEAISEFAQYQIDPEPTEPIWRIKAEAVERLVEIAGVRDQDRDPGNARVIAESAAAVQDPDECLQRCWASLEADALCEWAWHQIATVYADDKSELQKAAAPMMIAAVLGREPAAWADALILTAVAGDADLAEAIAVAALDDQGAEFADAVRRSTDHMSREAQEELLNFVDHASTHLEPREGGFRLRVFDDTGQTMEIGMRSEP